MEDQNKSQPTEKNLPTFIIPIQKTYANATQNLLKKDQGILLDCMDGSTNLPHTRETRSTDKRGHSAISSTDSVEEFLTPDPRLKLPPAESTVKKRKLTQSKDSTTNQDKQVTNQVLDGLDTQLSSIKEYLNKGITLLNYDDFKSFLVKVKGAQNPLDIISQYSNDLEEFSKFLKNNIHANVKNSSIKRRCTLLLKKKSKITITLTLSLLTTHRANLTLNKLN